MARLVQKSWPGSGTCNVINRTIRGQGALICVTFWRLRGQTGVRHKKRSELDSFMTRTEKLNVEFERVTADLAKRMVVAQLTEFEEIWQTANAICDRYGVGASCLEPPKAA